MNQRERIADTEDALRLLVRGELVGTWTCMPAIVQSYDDTNCTITAQPTIRGQFRQTDGSWTEVEMPLLIHVPVLMFAGSGCTLTGQPRDGDECIVWFADRCIDNWWVAGGVQSQVEYRMHDISDGMALVGLRSLPRVLSGGTAADGMEMRTDDGHTSVKVGVAGTVTIKAPAGLILDGIATVPSVSSPSLSIPVMVGGTLVYLKASPTP